MDDAEIQIRLQRINGAYHGCIDELQSHGIDTNPLVSLEVELFALADILIREIEGQREKIRVLRQHPALQD